MCVCECISHTMSCMYTPWMSAGHRKVQAMQSLSPTDRVESTCQRVTGTQSSIVQSAAGGNESVWVCLSVFSVCMLASSAVPVEARHC